MRILLSKSDQIYFFKQIKLASGLNREALGRLVGISGRSFSDWTNAKTLPTKHGLTLLSREFSIEIPRILSVREEWWSGRLNGRNAALAKYKKYGYFGQLKGVDRSRGGFTSQQNRKHQPEYYKSIGCIVPNTFRNPIKSKKLAEFVGVVLGDGCLTRDQCQISLNSIDDRRYSQYLQVLIANLFDYTPSIILQKKQSLIRVIVSGVNFVNQMNTLGLKIGNKTKQEVDMPNWIKDNKNFYLSCMKGLFDTDGGTFIHRHWSGGHYYRHFGLTFTSASQPLLNSYSHGLTHIGVKHRKRTAHIYIDNMFFVKRFFQIVTPSNSKHLDRYQNHLSTPTRIK